jgi:peptide/nickel transport system permease protein/oligopeptide transport system permease protein
MALRKNASPPSESDLDALVQQAEQLGKARTVFYYASRRFVRNRIAVTGLVLVSLLLFMAIAAPLITSSGPNEQDFLEEVGKAPSWRHPLGVDTLGRDYWSRIVYGARISLSIGIMATLVSFTIGLPLGAAAGMLGGVVDWIVMRTTEVLGTIPSLLLGILILVLLGTGVQNMLIAIAVTGWIGAARLIRGQVFSVREEDYVWAAKSLGLTNWDIMWQHLIPNSFAPLLISVATAIPGAIMAEAGLSFLGIGINPPTPSWGQMLSEGLPWIRSYWWLAAWPAVMVALAMLAFNFVADGLRDALDPRTR